MRRFLATIIPVLLLVSMAGLRAIDLRTARADQVRAAEARAANLAEVTSTYLGETFASTDATLRQLVVQARRIGGPGAPSSEWIPVLQVARAGLPIGAISITDAYGTIKHSTQPTIVGQSRRDEATFRSLMQTGADVLIAGAPFPIPVPGPDGGRFVIPLGRKLFDDEGRVTGTVVVSFIPGVPQQFLRSVDVG